MQKDVRRSVLGRPRNARTSAPQVLALPHAVAELEIPAGRHLSAAVSVCSPVVRTMSFLCT
jgi:hypothetical protein